MNQKEIAEQEARWRAESDARTLVEADRIKKDEKRLKAAQDVADEMSKAAKEESDSLEKIKDPKNQKWVDNK